MIGGGREEDLLLGTTPEGAGRRDHTVERRHIAGLIFDNAECVEPSRPSRPSMTSPSDGCDGCDVAEGASLICLSVIKRAPLPGTRWSSRTSTPARRKLGTEQRSADERLPTAQMPLVVAKRLLLNPVSPQHSLKSAPKIIPLLAC